VDDAPDKLSKTLMLKVQPDLMAWLKLEAQRRRTTVAYVVRTLLYNELNKERKVVNE
jgi:hypothetical protein